MVRGKNGGGEGERDVGWAGNARLCALAGYELLEDGHVRLVIDVVLCTLRRQGQGLVDWRLGPRFPSPTEPSGHDGVLRAQSEDISHLSLSPSLFLALPASARRRLRVCHGGGGVRAWLLGEGRFACVAASLCGKESVDGVYTGGKAVGGSGGRTL